MVCFAAPFQEPAFRWLLPLSALIQGSHALYYGFSTIHWTAAGLSPGVIGLLWAEGVVVEVLLFLYGRQEHTDVEVTGDDTAVAKVRRANLGI